MSLAVLLQAVEDRTREILTAATGVVWDRQRTIIGDDGTPPPFMGEYFAVIHPGTFDNRAGASALALDEYCDVSLTLTQRIRRAPKDRLGQAILVKALTGLYPLAEALRAAGGLNVDYKTLQYCGGTFNPDLGAAGVWAGGKPYSLSAAVQGFGTPLKFRQPARLMLKGADWFSATDDNECGAALRLDFVGARRLQHLASAT